MRVGIAAVVLVGCDGEDPAAVEGDPCLAADMGVSPGTGDRQYEALEDGDHVQIVHGPQGGWHVETAGLVAHSAFDVKVVGTLTHPDLGVVSDAGPVFIGLVHEADQDCGGAFYGIKTYVGAVAGGSADDQLFVCSLEEETLTFSITVTDIFNERETTTEVDVVADLDPGDFDDCHPGR